MSTTTLGHGLGFPPRIGADGRFVVSSGDEHVRESLRLILLTQKNERLLLPEFGAGLARFLFAPNTASTHRLIQDAILLGIARWEPRVEQVGVQVNADPSDPKSVAVVVRYRVTRTRNAGEIALALRLSE